MPKFFYTMVAVTLLTWVGVLFLGTEIRPDSNFHIFVFMMSVFAAISLTLTTLMFIYFHVRASMFMNRHALFRKSLKYGFFAGFCLSGFLMLKAFELNTTTNYVLFAALCLMLYTQFKSRRI